MALLAIWLDGEKAKLFEFTSEKINHTEMKDPSPQHHTHSEDQMAQQKKEQSFFKTLVPHLQSASEVMITGPGMSRTHFQKFLSEHHADISKKVVACEASDHPTEPQIVALARKHFSAEHMHQIKA